MGRRPYPRLPTVRYAHSKMRKDPTKRSNLFIPSTRWEDYHAYLCYTHSQMGRLPYSLPLLCPQPDGKHACRSCWVMTRGCGDSRHCRPGGTLLFQHTRSCLIVSACQDNHTMQYASSGPSSGATYPHHQVHPCCIIRCVHHRLHHQVRVGNSLFCSSLFRSKSLISKSECERFTLFAL